MKTFPKNIRQIGEPGAGRKILIEDYVYTYLRQLAEDDLTCMKTAILVGYPDSLELRSDEMQIVQQGRHLSWMVLSIT